MNGKAFQSQLRERLAYLTPGQRKIAQYILDNLERACYQTIAQIAKEAELSETTVIRLAYSLDFISFSEMQKSIRDSVSNNYGKKSKQESVTAPKHLDPYTAHSAKGIELLQKTLVDLDKDEIDAAVETMVNAKQVIVIGFRSSANVAGWFSNTLSVIRPNVRLLSSMNDAHNVLLDINADTVVVSIIFMTYSKHTLYMTEFAKSKGAHIIAITDGLWSPITPYADTMLCTASHRISGCFNSLVPSAFILDLLILGAIARSPDFEKRLEELDTISGILPATLSTTTKNP